MGDCANQQCNHRQPKAAAMQPSMQLFCTPTISCKDSLKAAPAVRHTEWWSDRRWLLQPHLLLAVHSLVLLQCCILPLCVAPELNDLTLTRQPPLPGTDRQPCNKMALQQSLVRCRHNAVLLKRSTVMLQDHPTSTITVPRPHQCSLLL